MKKRRNKKNNSYQRKSSTRLSKETYFYANFGYLIKYLFFLPKWNPLFYYSVKNVYTIQT